MPNSISSNMEQYAIYLRKSRKDVEAEMMGAGETLARHEKIMLDLAKSRNLIISKIYKEIVSGDSISARPVMQELLQDVDSGLYKGILVVEIERLARGNTMDQGIVAETFKWSNTKIITPTKVYDPNNEFDEEYFEFGLFMSRREYKTIRRRLHNGTISSIKEGKTVYQAPFGYEKIKLKGKGFSFKIVEEKAQIIKTIFEMYTNGKNLGDIVRFLEELNIPTPGNGKKWYKTTIQKILTNPTYIGKVHYTDKKTIKKRNASGKIISVKNPEPEIYIIDGIHQAIISEEIFQKAQSIYKSHQLADTRTKDQLELKNPLSGIIKCKVCGGTLKRNFATSAFSQYARLECKNHDVASSHQDVIEARIFESLKIILNNYKLDLKKTSSVAEIQSLISSTDNQILQLYSELEKTESQKGKLYDLLEQGVYTNEIFLERSKLLASKIAELNDKIDTLNQLKKDYQNKQTRQEQIIPEIENVIETYPYATIEQKNRLLKSCIEKIEYYKPKGTRKTDFDLTIYPRF
ncbi:MAG: recombinase family protein [Clostridia bacterium]|nr:recombinase family protein [Clostridia bacterium]